MEMRVTTDEALLEAVTRLDESVTVLTNRLSVQRKQARFTRRIAAAVGAIVLLGGLGVFLAIQTNHDTQVQSCENANQSRAANLQLWSYVLDIASADAAPPDAKNLNRIKAWVAILYQPHDCDDLGREYKIPPPPDLSTPAPS